MIAPLAPSLPPLGAGVHVMPRYYLYKTSLAFFEKTGNTALSQPGRHERAGRSPWSVKQFPMISSGLYFSITQLFSAAITRVLASLPQRGMQHAGSTPLDYFRGFRSTFSRDYRIRGTPEHGGGGTKCWNPRERLSVCRNGISPERRNKKQDVIREERGYLVRRRGGVPSISSRLPQQYTGPR
jgi:hypothetical protein